jgi:hypothetical protein
MSNTVRFSISLLAGACLFVATAATSSIGVVRSSGEFRLDGSIVRGNSTVFDGNLIETTTTRSIVQLDAGQVTLAPESRAKVYHDRTVLEKGAGLLRDAAGKHEFEAASLHIVPTAKDSVIQVDIQAQGRIAVVARDGEAQVRTSSGVLVASLRTGMELAFDPQAGASKAVKITGVLEQRNGNYFVTDATTHVTFQIQGNNLAQYVGKKVVITGSLIPGATPAAGATQVVQAADIQLAPAAAAGTAGGAAAAGAHTATIAIVGGVAVGGTVIGLVSAGTFSGGSSTSAP